MVTGAESGKRCRTRGLRASPPDGGWTGVVRPQLQSVTGWRLLGVVNSRQRALLSSRKSSWAWKCRYWSSLGAQWKQRGGPQHRMSSCYSLNHNFCIFCCKSCFVKSNSWVHILLTFCAVKWRVHKKRFCITKYDSCEKRHCRNWLVRWIGCFSHGMPPLTWKNNQKQVWLRSVVDFFLKVNKVRLSLQGKQVTVFVAKEKIWSFKWKLEF